MYYSFLLFQERMTRQRIFIVELLLRTGKRLIQLGRNTLNGFLLLFVSHIKDPEIVLDSAGIAKGF